MNAAIAGARTKIDATRFELSGFVCRTIFLASGERARLWKKEMFSCGVLGAVSDGLVRLCREVGKKVPGRRGGHTKSEATRAWHGGGGSIGWQGAMLGRFAVSCRQRRLALGRSSNHGRRSDWRRNGFQSFKAFPLVSLRSWLEPSVHWLQRCQAVSVRLHVTPT